MTSIDSREDDRVVYWVDTLARPHDVATKLEFARWLEESPQNRRDYVAQRELDDLLSRMPPPRKSIDELFAEAAAAFSEPDEDDDVYVTSTPGVAARFATFLEAVPWKQLSVAILIITMVAGATALYATRWVDYRADATSRTVRLQDDSVVTLLPHSHVRMRVLLRERQFVQESGASSLAVHHDEARRFFVDTPQARVEALGTRLNVNRRQNDTLIFLRAGALRITNGHAAPISLSPGEFTQIDDRGDISKPRSLEEMRAREIPMKVSGKTVAEVAAAFNRENSDVQFVIQGAVANQVTVDFGYVDLADPAGWMEMLRHDSMTVHFDPKTGLAIVSGE